MWVVWVRAVVISVELAISVLLLLSLLQSSSSGTSARSSTTFCPRTPSTSSPQGPHHRSSAMQSSHSCSVGHPDNKRQKLAMGKLADPKCEKWEQCRSSEQSWRHSSTEETPGKDSTRLSAWISQAWPSMKQAPEGKPSKAGKNAWKRA